MPGPLDAEFAAALIASGLPPAQVLDAARRAALESSTLLGWLAQQRQLEPARLERVLASIPPIPCPSCQQPLPLGDLWPRLDAGCPRCSASLSTAGVEGRIGAVCQGQADPGRPATVPQLNETVPAPGAPTPGTGLSVGQTFHGFELLQELGRGGMGVVFRARQATPRREVALKILFTRGTPETLRARFRREIDTLASLSGEPGIVNIFEAGEDRGLLYFAMELVPGGSLADLVRRAPIDPAEALQLAADTARALHVAHEAGVVHRDVKPANVLLTPSGRPKVGDFGLVLSATDERVTRSGDVIGTPLYLAPEQLDTHDVDRRCDVYALGVVLYQLLTGQHPYPQASGTAQLYTAILSKPHVELLKAAPDLPPALERVTQRALLKDPDQRYPTALAFAEDLDRCRLTLTSAEPAATPASSSATKPLLIAVVGSSLVLVGLYTQRGRFGSPQAAHPSATPTLPAPTPTGASTPSAPLVERLKAAVVELRSAADRGDPVKTGEVMRRSAALLEQARGDPAVGRLPIAYTLAAWVGRLLDEPPYGLPAADRALENARGIQRAWALEAQALGAAMSVAAATTTRDKAQLLTRAQVATAELLQEYPDYVPIGELFSVGQQAGEFAFEVAPLKVFAPPTKMRRPNVAPTATRYFQALAARNTKNAGHFRPRHYAALAALQFARNDLKRTRALLDQAVACDPARPYARVVRGAFLLRSELDPRQAALDLDAAEQRVKNVEEGHRWHDLRRRLEALQHERAIRHIIIMWAQLRAGRIERAMVSRNLTAIRERHRRLERHPMLLTLRSWLAWRTNPPDPQGARRLATLAVQRSPDDLSRIQALEARVVASNPKDSLQKAQIVTDVEAILAKERRSFQPHPDVFNRGNDAGTHLFRAHGLTTFGYPDKLRPPALVQPERARRFFTLLVARNRSYKATQAFSYARLAAVLLGLDDHTALAETLDAMVATNKTYFFGRLLRGSYRLHRGKLDLAAEDLAVARAWFDRHPTTYVDIAKHLAGLEAELKRRR